jgi:chromosome segregation ATPase
LSRYFAKRFEVEVLEQQKVRETMEQQYEQEIIVRKNIELLFSHERKEMERRWKEQEIQIENLQADIQLTASEKTMMESTLVTINDQKKVLIKEVKQLRKKLEESQMLIDELRAMNLRLVENTETMQKDFEDVRGKWSESQQSLKVTLQQLHQIQQEQQHQQQEQQVQHQNHSEVEGGDSTKSLASSESIPPPEAELVNESVLQQDYEELINKFKDSHSPAPSVTSQHNFGEEDETNRDSFISESNPKKFASEEDDRRESLFLK